MENDSISEPTNYRGLEIHTIESVEFKEVSFKYPGSSDFALRKIAFIVNKGSKVTVVGKNGSGKSTLITKGYRCYHMLGRTPNVFYSNF